MVRTLNIHEGFWLIAPFKQCLRRAEWWHETVLEFWSYTMKNAQDLQAGQKMCVPECSKQVTFCVTQLV